MTKRNIVKKINMNMGLMIDKFERTDQTVKDFNDLFTHVLIKPQYSLESIVTIGGIVGTGNALKRFITVNDELIEHDFTYCTLGRGHIDTGKVYIARDIVGDELNRGVSIMDLSRKMNCSPTVIEKRLKHGLVIRNDMYSDKYLFTVDMEE